MQTLRWYAKHSPEDQVIFLITTRDVQTAAWEQLGKHLTEDELRTAKKCIESGLSSGLDVIVNTAIEEAIT